MSNLELTRAILELTGAGEDLIERVKDRLGHERRYSITTDKVRALGWAPQRNFADALAATVGWYRDNRWWWEPLRGTGA
jgi:dTDP-glucose 4,6-dehydratase